MTHTSRVDFVVPVYNEKENFSVLYENLKKLVQAEWNIYLVYDFPDDSTLEVARPLSQVDPRIHLVENTGKGVLGAIVTGFGVAESDAIMVVMVDETPDSIKIFDVMVERFYSHNAAIVVASRYMKGGHAYGAPFLKGLLSRISGVSLYYVIGLPTHDATNATRLYRKSFLRSVRVESDKGFALTLELTIKAHLKGLRIEEIPVTWREREVGTSRFSLRKWILIYLRWYMYGLTRYYFSFMYAGSKNTQQSS